MMSSNCPVKSSSRLDQRH